MSSRIAGDYVPHDYITPHYSTKMMRGQYFYFQKHYTESIFSEVCQQLGMPLQYLLKDSNWVSAKFTIAYCSALAQRVGLKPEELSERFGRDQISPEALSPIEYALCRFTLTPFLFYLGLPAQYKKYNRHNTLKVLKRRPGYFEYSISPKVDTDEESPIICANTVGMMSSTTEFFNLNQMIVTHPECRHKGGRVCRYTVRYSAKSFWRRTLLKLLGASALSAAGYATLSISTTEFNLAAKALYFLTCGVTVAAVTLARSYLGVLGGIQQYHDQSHEKALELQDKQKRLDRRHQESGLLRDLAMSMGQIHSPKDLLSNCLESLGKRFGFPRSFVMILDEEDKKLKTFDARGFGDETHRVFKLAFDFPGQKDHPQLFANILESGEIAYISDISEYKKKLKDENKVLLETMKVNSIIVCPLQDSDYKYGLLVVGAMGTDTALTQDDRHMIESVGRMLSVQFHKARVFEREKSLRKLFEQYAPAVVIEGVRKFAPEDQIANAKVTYITSFFSDIRGFTSMCENLAPEVIGKVLNAYTEYCFERLSATGGIIDRLIGDAIHAFYPADERLRTAHTKLALLSALHIFRDLRSFNDRLQAQALPRLNLGIGLHCGFAQVGAFGSRHKLDYTAIGDTVNVAARLQDVAKDIHYKISEGHRPEGTLVLSDAILSRSGIQIPAMKLDLPPLRGRSEAQMAYVIHNHEVEAWFKTKEAEPLGNLATLAATLHQMTPVREDSNNVVRFKKSA